MKFENIIYEKQGRVATLAINRPDKLNALNLATRREISTLLDQVAQDKDVGVLMLTGAGDRSFIAGSDLNEFGRMSPLEAYDFMNTLAQRPYTRFEELDIPVIAINTGQEVGLTPGLAFEALAEVACFCSPEKEEGMNAFFSKRKPEFHKK